MRTESFKIGAVEIDVTFKSIKNLHLSVHPPYGKVTIASPEFYNLEKVKVYAATKLAWIKKEQQKFLLQKREEPREYIGRESHYFLGTRHLLHLTQSNRNNVVLNGRKLCLGVQEVENESLKKSTLYRFYRKELRKRLSHYIGEYAERMNLDIPHFKIRYMKTKWGSCATNSSRLWFNIELAKKPLECIEYIVVHELVHLIERNHNKNFIMLMNKYMPGWRTQKKLLNELPIGNG